MSSAGVRAVEPTSAPTHTPSAEAGFSLVALMAGTTIMLILMGMATPFWRYVTQDMREEELIFRGSQIAEALERYRRKNANTYPASLEVLVKGKYLRKDYKDPMTPSGKWRVVTPGEAIAVAGSRGWQAPAPGPGSSPPPAVPHLPGTEAKVAGDIGPVAGVVSTSTLKGFRKFNGRERYNEWAFIAGQPRNVGDQMLPVHGGGPLGPLGAPGVPTTPPGTPPQPPGVPSPRPDNP